MAGKIKVPSELVPSQSNQVMLRSKYIYDDVKGHTQEEVNAALEEQIESKVIQAGGVNWDTIPTAGSDNAVKSKDIKAALEKVTGYFVLDSNVTEATIAKTVTVSDFPNLALGGSVKIKMLTENTAANPTLRIGPSNAPAYPLYYNNEIASANNSWEEGEVISVYFDGTNYQASNAQGGGGKAEKIKYDKSQSKLTSTNVQGAIDEIDERTIVQKEITITLKNGWAASTTWTKNTYYNKHAVIPIGDILDGISIKANATRGGRYGFLSSYPSTIENGDTVTWCDGTGRNNIDAGETVTVMKTDFPEDCQYVYIGIANNTSASATDNNYLPQAINAISYCKRSILDIESEIAAIEEEITLIDTSTNIIDGQTAVNGWPGTNGWVSNSNNWKGYFITVRAGEMYRITANASNTTKVVMLRNSSHTNGAAVNGLAAYSISPNQYQDVIVPSGATCMWVDELAGSGVTTTPQSIYAYYGELLDVVISHSNRIGELEDEVGESDIMTITITSYNSGYYIQADSTNANFGNAIQESNTDYAVSPFINVKGYNSFSVSTLTSGRQYAGTVVYNAAKEPIAGYYYYSGSSGSYLATGELPSDAAYIRISHWTNNFSNGSVKLHLYDTLKNFTVRKVSETEDRISALESRNIPSGLTTHDYIGDKISFAIHQFTGNRYMTLSPSAYTVQGGAVFGDYYMVGFSNHAYLDVYNLATKTKLASITLEAPSISNAHANTVFFSNQYHTDGDEFPILYMCSGYNSDGYSKVYGYRVVNDNGSWSATIVHTITINSEGKWTEMVVDNVRQKAWIKKEISGTKEWYCVDMPQYVNGDATIDLSILEPNFIAPSYESSGQCHLFFNDRIFFISGIPSDNVSKLYVLNTLTGKYESIVNLIPVFGTDEPENIIIYNGYLHVGYRTLLGRLYFD